MSRGRRQRGPSLRDLAGGIRFSGGVAELRANGVKCGLIYDYEFAGREKNFRLEAERYKLDPVFWKGTLVTVRMDIGRGRLEATGHAWGEPMADGRIHDGLIVKGGNIRWARKAPVAPLNGRQMAGLPKRNFSNDSVVARTS